MKRLFCLLAVALSVCAEVGAQEKEHLLQLYGGVNITDDRDAVAGFNITFRKNVTEHTILGFGFGHRAAWAGDSVDIDVNRNTLLFSLPVFLHSRYRFNDWIEAGLDVGYLSHYRLKEYKEQVIHDSLKPNGAFFLRPGLSFNIPFNMSIDMGAMLSRNRYGLKITSFERASFSAYIGITYHFK